MKSAAPGSNPKWKKKLAWGLDYAVFTVPALLLVIYTTLLPFLMNVVYSFTDWDGIKSQVSFVGWEHFVRIFTRDAKFWGSVGFNLRFALFYVVVVNVLALLLATALYRRGRLSTLARSLFFVPYVISIVAISLTWRFILTSGFATLYQSTGWLFFNQSWLGSPGLAFYTLVFLSVWQNVGFYMMIYIAGLMGVPADVMEAADIDGASSLRAFLTIKLPLIMPSVTVCLFTSTLFALKLFDIILVLTKGGPANATMSVTFNIYKEAFGNYHYGLATAKSLVFFLFCTFITVLQTGLTKRREVEL